MNAVHNIDSIAQDIQDFEVAMVAHRDLRDSIMSFLSMLVASEPFPKPLEYWSAIVFKAVHFTRPHVALDVLTEKEKAFSNVSTVFLTTLLKELKKSFLDQETTETTVDLSKICTLMYSYNKKHAQHGKSVAVGLLTPGTIIETSLYTVGGDYYTKLPKRVTVKEVEQNDVGDFLVTTVEEFASPTQAGVVESLRFSASYVAKVVQHVPGKLKYVKERRQYDRRETDKKTRYEFMHLSAFIYFILLKFNLVSSIEGTVDMSKFIERLIMTGMLRKVKLHPEERYSDYLYSGNKKRINRFIKQNANRFLISASERRLISERLAASYDLD